MINDKCTSHNVHICATNVNTNLEDEALKEMSLPGVVSLKTGTGQVRGSFASALRPSSVAAMPIPVLSEAQTISTCVPSSVIPRTSSERNNYN